MAIQVKSSKDMGAKPLHTFVYGPLRTGKTTFGASFPNPVFISSRNEGGDTTLRFYNVDVIEVSDHKDVREAVTYIQQMAPKHGWKTVVIDSVTYLSDLYIQELTKNGERPMQQRDWGMLDLFLQKWLLPEMRKLPLHVVWIANEEPIKSDAGVVGYQPMLYGKTSTKLPGACDLIVRSIVQNVRNQQGALVPQYVLRTVSMEGSAAGGRFGTAFSDGVIPAHFAAIAQRIGPYIGEDPSVWAQAVPTP